MLRQLCGIRRSRNRCRNLVPCFPYCSGPIRKSISQISEIDAGVSVGDLLQDPPEVGGSAEREELPLQDSDRQRQAAGFRSGLPDTCLGPAGWPQSKVPAKTTTVAPDGFCVVSDLLWREPELLDFAAAVQFGLIVVVR